VETRKSRNKAYKYKTFGAARAKGYTFKQYTRSKTAIKTWDNLPQLQKDIRVENLQAGKKKARLKKKFEKKKQLPKDDYVDVYEIVSQSHYDARGINPKTKRPYKTLFEYTTKGYFENEPSFGSIETMTKNSLIAAFNSGKSGNGSYLKRSAFDKLVVANMRGVKVEKVKIKASELNNLNRLDAELSIKNNNSKWIGKN
jgi:hypothetical protein